MNDNYDKNIDHSEEEFDEEPVFVEFEDENHNIIRCIVSDGFEFKGRNYCVVSNEEDGSSYVFRLTDEDELVVPDEKEFEEAAAYYETLIEED